MNILIISNPTSGSYNDTKLSKCADILSKKYGLVEVKYTTAPEEASSIAAGATADMVIAAGGDGLLNETAAGLLGKDVIFSVLPMGTVNVFCREHKIPLNPVKAAERIDVSRLRKLPLGFLGARPFLLMCGFGFDARVVKQVEESKLPVNKTVKHLSEGAKSFNEEYPELIVFTNNKKYHAYHVIISLGHFYAGNFPLSKTIRDDKLNIFLHQNPKPKSLVYSILSVAVGKGLPVNPIFSETAKVSGTSFVQLDGEFIETSTAHNYISMKKEALTAAI
jgi:diacylglycerol kinase family enzyme